jgi:PKD repeat protein
VVAVCALTIILLLAGVFVFETATGPGLVVTVVATTSSGAHPLKVTFYALVRGGKSPYSYSWSFGGNSGILSADWTETYTFTARGSYVASVTVADSAGHQTSTRYTVTVLPSLEAVNVSRVSALQVGPGVGNAVSFGLAVPIVAADIPGNAVNASLSGWVHVTACSGGDTAACDLAFVAVMTSEELSSLETYGMNSLDAVWCRSGGTWGCQAEQNSSIQANLTAESGSGLDLVIWNTNAVSLQTLASNVVLYSEV